MINGVLVLSVMLWATWAPQPDLETVTGCEEQLEGEGCGGLPLPERGDLTLVIGHYDVIKWGIDVTQENCQCTQTHGRIFFPNVSMRTHSWTYTQHIQQSTQSTFIVLTLQRSTILCYIIRQLFTQTNGCYAVKEAKETNGLNAVKVYYSYK